MCDKKTDNKSLSYWWLLGLAVVVIFVQLGFGYWLICSFGTETDPWAMRGQFGDMFGAVNTLFSGLAFAGVIFAIILQSKELSLQRSELALSREVNKAAAEAQAEQADLLKQASKMKALEMEIEVKIAILNMHLESVGAGKDGGMKRSLMGLPVSQFPTMQREMENVVAELKKLAEMKTEPSTPQQ